jgi:hypothetical protein
MPFYEFIKFESMLGKKRWRIYGRALIIIKLLIYGQFLNFEEHCNEEGWNSYNSHYTEFVRSWLECLD